MNLITRDELLQLMNSSEDFKLVMTLKDWAFRSKRIPGSIRVSTPEHIFEQLNVDDQIIVYCSDVNCYASKLAYQLMVENGFTNVRRYAGGVLDWEEHGLPLEGEWVGEMSTSQSQGRIASI